MIGKISLLLVAMLLAGPAVAQAPPPPGAGGGTDPDVRVMRMKRGPMFGNVSPEGRQMLGAAMRSVSREDRMELRAARDRINALVAAERLDLGAVRQAMADERKLVDSHHAKRQAALLATLPKLSAADRKAFAEDARRGRAGVEARTAEWRRWAEEYRLRMKDLPPPAQ